MDDASDRLAIHTVGSEPTAPDAGGTIRAFSRMGYSVAEAVADLIDNSIDAGASVVNVRLYRSLRRIERIVIADNGNGLKPGDLREAMRFGGRRQHNPTDLGKYGIGLKAASLNQARAVSLISRSGEHEVSGRRWRSDVVEADGWMCDILDEGDCRRLLDEDWQVLSTRPHGTLVVWDELEQLVLNRKGVQRNADSLFGQLRVGLGLTYHRFLKDLRIQIFMSSFDLSGSLLGAPEAIVALDPFGYTKSPRAGYPCLFKPKLDKYVIPVEAHIWPPKTRDPGYVLGGGRAAAGQGFYFFRNDRLLQPGGWNGYRDHESEPHLSLARVAIDLPPELDEQFKISAQKSAVEVPQAFIDALQDARAGKTSLQDYIVEAQAVYRGAREAERRRSILGIGEGFRAPLREIVNTVLGDGLKVGKKIGLRWVGDLADDEVVALDGDDLTILLNRKYRSAVLRGRRGTTGDAPVVKALLFLLLRSDVQGSRVSKTLRNKLRELNAVLVAALADDSD